MVTIFHGTDEVTPVPGMVAMFQGTGQVNPGPDMVAMFQDTDEVTPVPDMVAKLTKAGVFNVQGGSVLLKILSSTIIA